MRTRAWAWAVLPAAAALALGGCASRLLPPEPSSTPLSAEALRRVQSMYLYPERIDRDLLIGALDALEQRFDSVRFAYDGVSREGLLQVGDASASVPLDWEFETRRYLHTLGQALRFVEANLQEPLEEDEDLELIALRGALAQLDPYSTVFSGEGSEDFKIRFSGTLSGIGARIGRRDGHLIAIAVFPDGPAAQAGLRDGDWILTIDGDPTQPLSVSAAVERLRGETGTHVRLGIQRGEQQLDLDVVRSKVNVPTVETRELGGGLGYARILSVSSTTEEEFRTKLRALGQLDGLVLDLRGNSGGSMHSARQIADAFMEGDLIVRTVGRGDQRSEMVATPRVLFRLPVVVLVDPQTASAAEILAGALEPLDTITVVGQTTYGKGHIQQVVPLPGERLLKLTVAEYRLSGDRAVNDVGILPEVRLAPVPALRFGLLASVSDGEIAYVRAPGEEDAFPIEAARLLLTQDHAAALQAIRALADDQIASELAKHQVTWTPPANLPDPVPQALQLQHSAAPLVAGRTGAMELRVFNPNPFPIPSAWAVLDAPAPYLSEKIASLGTIGAGQTARTTFELTPPEGITVREHLATAHVGAGRRWLASQELVLEIATESPQIEIEVRRLTPDEIQVAIANAGPHATGPVLIAVPGSTRALETIAAGAREEATLQLSAEPKDVAITLTGPWAQRRIDVPIPAEVVRVIPPAIDVQREVRRGVARIAVRARDPGGLREAWIQLSGEQQAYGQKQAYAAWRGRTEGSLSAALEGGEQDIVVKVENSAGVSVIDARRLRGDYEDASAAP